MNRYCRVCHKEYHEHRRGPYYKRCPECSDESMPLGEKLIVAGGVVVIVLIVAGLWLLGKI